MGGKFTGCSGYVYDTEGNLLTTIKIDDHDSSENSIEVPSSQVLLDYKRCELLILSSPAPYACSGFIHRSGHKISIKLFKGKERENRRTVRYALSGKTLVTAYIYEVKKYRLHTPIDIDLVNISTSGIRLSGRFNTLSLEDKFNINLKIGNSVKVLAAEVVNLRDIERERSEYGCILIGDVDE